MPEVYPKFQTQNQNGILPGLIPSPSRRIIASFKLRVMFKEVMKGSESSGIVFIPFVNLLVPQLPHQLKREA